jgi:hypothetical protein
MCSGIPPPRRWSTRAPALRRSADVLAIDPQTTGIYASWTSPLYQMWRCHGWEIPHESSVLHTARRHLEYPGGARVSEMRAERTLCATLSASLNPMVSVSPSGRILQSNGPGPLGPAGQGAAQRLSMARGFLTYLRATIPATEVPDSALVASFRRPKPYLFTPDQIRTLIQDAKKARPQERPTPSYPLHPHWGCWLAPDYGSVRALRLMVTDVWLRSEPPCLPSRNEVLQVTARASASEYG